MKRIKFNFGLIVLTILAISFSGSGISCSDDNGDDTSVDKTELASAISEAEALIDSTEEGTAEGQYAEGSQNDLQEVIDACEEVYEDEDATQTEVDNAVTNLEAAIDEYEGNVVEAIDADDLVGQWTFDEGTGTTLEDYSGNGHDGTLESGSDTWGGDYPEWTTDRYGNENRALSFDLGAYVLIPYSSDLNPTSAISISLWIKADEVLESNRFMGLHSWLGYKFQLQASNYPYFSITNTDGTCYDEDAGIALDLDTWYHLVVTAGDDEMVFYINGEEVKTVDDITGTFATETNDLVFGRDADEYASSTDNYDTDAIIPLSWGGYFHGSMDEVRIYKTVLSASQVSSIYELEKVSDDDE